MYPTFSGSSRRPRNVNLSGQQSNNPFASGGSWGAPSGSGTAQSIANAQAERRQRQEERDRLKAAKDFQRLWRGHKARRDLRQDRRREFDRLYNDPQRVGASVQERLGEAVLLLLYRFDSGNDDDCRRLEMLAKDMEGVSDTDFAAIPRPSSLLTQVLRTLDHPMQASLSSSLFSLLINLAHSSPEAVQNNLGPYFRLLSKYSQATNYNSEELAILRRAVTSPLQSKSQATGSAESGSLAYEEFVLNYLTQPLPAVEICMDKFMGHVDFQLVSTSIIRAFSSEAAHLKTHEELLWLLSHFIALMAANVSTQALHLKALLVQISDLSTVIRVRLQEKDVSSSSSSSTELPPFIKDQLSSLVSSSAISRLLVGFTFGSESAQDIENATMLAGYTLALIRCFPAQGDEIRMRLYLADMSTDGAKLPSLSVFWMAMQATSAFQRIRDSSAESALQFLSQRNYFPASSSQDSHWDREWRAILLFLELYTFVLRLTDDDDFFAKLNTDDAHMEGQETVSRLKSCALGLQDLTSLTLFLKNLAFTLHYHSAELLRSVERPSSRGSGRPRSLPQKDMSFEVISGVNFSAFKDTVTTAVSMLYERDSRRPFLPKDHWLMTANFDMAAFMSAVIMEEERLQELQDEDSDADSNEDEDDNSSAPVIQMGHANVQRLARNAAIEAMRLESQKAAKARARATLLPKLELLRHMPYVIPFHIRIALFRQFIVLDQRIRRDGHIDPDMWRLHMRERAGWSPNNGHLGRHHAKIKRGQIFEDAFDQFFDLGDGLKEPIQITFVDQFNTIEAGIDGGGVTKEFLLSVTQEAFDPKYGYFTANNRNLFFPNPYALDQREAALQAAGLDPNRDPEYGESITQLLSKFEFLGRVVGKCLYEGILMNVAFAGFFLLKWSTSSSDGSGYRASINDLRELDEELYQGLMRLKNYDGDVSDLALDFTINDQVSSPGEPIMTKTRDLVPGGSNLAVTNENRPLYISYTARHRLAAQPYRQTRAFLRGLETMIRPSWLSMFNQQELQRLVGGDSTEIDIDDLRKHTQYGGLYDPGTDPEDHPTIQMFWKLMQEIEDVDRRNVLKYVTSTPRAPLLGFSQLNPRFSIRDGGTDEARLPSASTCVNLLKLPRYTSYETLKSKLLYAVRSNAGFDLS